MTHFALLVFAVALIPGSVLARTVTLQFVSLPKNVNAGSIELLTEEGKSITIDAPYQDISKPYQVDQRKQWTVGKFENAADGTRKFTEYGSVKALDTRHQLVILIRKGATNADGFKVVVVANGLSQFGGGAFLLVNGSDKEIEAKLGAKKSTIAPDEHSISKPETDKGKRNCHVRFSFRNGEKMKPFFSTNWPVNQNARGLVCFYTDSKAKHLKMHMIRDFVK